MFGPLVIFLSLPGQFLLSQLPLPSPSHRNLLLLSAPISTASDAVVNGYTTIERHEPSSPSAHDARLVPVFVLLAFLAFSFLGQIVYDVVSLHLCTLLSPRPCPRRHATSDLLNRAFESGRCFGLSEAAALLHPLSRHIFAHAGTQTLAPALRVFNDASAKTLAPAIRVFNDASTQTPAPALRVFVHAGPQTLSPALCVASTQTLAPALRVFGDASTQTPAPATWSSAPAAAQTASKPASPLSLTYQVLVEYASSTGTSNQVVSESKSEVAPPSRAAASEAAASTATAVDAAAAADDDASSTTTGVTAQGGLCRGGLRGSGQSDTAKASKQRGTAPATEKTCRKGCCWIAVDELRFGLGVMG